MLNLVLYLCFMLSPHLILWDSSFCGKWESDARSGFPAYIPFFTYIRLFRHSSIRSFTLKTKGLYHYCGSYQTSSNHKSAVLSKRAYDYGQTREPMMPYVCVKLDMLYYLLTLHINKLATFLQQLLLQCYVLFFF